MEEHVETPAEAEPQETGPVPIDGAYVSFLEDQNYLQTQELCELRAQVAGMQAQLARTTEDMRRIGRSNVEHAKQMPARPASARRTSTAGMELLSDLIAQLPPGLISDKAIYRKIDKRDHSPIVHAQPSGANSVIYTDPVSFWAEMVRVAKRKRLRLIKREGKYVTVPINDR